MFSFITDTASSAVNLVSDTVEMVAADGNGPKRSDVAQLLAAGMTAVSVAFGVTEDVIERLASED